MKAMNVGLLKCVSSVPGTPGVPSVRRRCLPSCENLLTKWLSASTIQTFFSFVWKIGLILIAGVTLLYQTLCNRAGESAPEDRARFTGGIIPAGSVCLWIGVIFLGRFLPYLGS